MKIFECLPFHLTKPNHVSPLALPNQIMSPLYIVLRFLTYFNEKERAVIHCDLN